MPAGATVLDPVEPRPGLVVPPASGPRPTVVVLPGPPRELHEMWELARSTDAFRAAIAGATSYRRGIVACTGSPKFEIANTLVRPRRPACRSSALEMTTCLRRGEIEVATRYEAFGGSAYESLTDFIAERHGDQLSARATDRRSIGGSLGCSGRMVAVAQSCRAA